VLYRCTCYKRKRENVWMFLRVGDAGLHIATWALTSSQGGTVDCMIEHAAKDNAPLGSGHRIETIFVCENFRHATRYVQEPWRIVWNLPMASLFELFMGPATSKHH